MPDALAARLRDAVERLIGPERAAQDRFGLAVSGGADSMALLGLSAQIFPGRIAAATVDHRLRPEAADEARMVVGWCGAHAVAHATLVIDRPISGNLQADARERRYALLEEWRASQELDWLMTAHQADDQIETMVMRLNRGAGVSGLAAIRARRGRVLRPLLTERRATLRAWCIAKGIPFVDDPSNDDAHFDRVRLRRQLDGAALFNPAGVARSVEALAEAEAALQWMTGQAEASHVTALADGLSLDPANLPQELVRRLLLAMIARVHPAADTPRGPSVDQALLQLFAGKTVALADCVISGGRCWTVRRAPPRRSG